VVPTQCERLACLHESLKHNARTGQPLEAFTTVHCNRL
jgi:hypothetical protein